MTTRSADDSLDLLGMAEDPDRWEAAVLGQHGHYASDAEIRALLDSIYLEPDRDRAFDRFYNGFEFATIRKIMTCLGVDSKDRLCEIGGGPGFLAWALARSGYAAVDLVEPNDRRLTGTGYLSGRDDAHLVHVEADFERWHGTNKTYAHVVTKNCIHHFPNIAHSAALIRQKLNEDGFWFAFREQFADTPQELYSLLSQHPYCQRYKIYEWAYPSWQLAEMIELAGFALHAVVPYDYANNTLGTYVEDLGDDAIQQLTREVDGLLATAAAETVQRFRTETDACRKGEHRRFYSRPQLMVFRKISIA